MKIILKETTPSLRMEDRITRVIKLSNTIFPDGISTGLIEAEGDILVGLSAGVAMRLSGGDTDDLVLIRDSTVSGGWRIGTLPSGSRFEMTNKSGSDLAAGAVVVPDTANAGAFVTTTDEGRADALVLTEAIVNNDTGIVTTAGYRAVLVQGNAAVGDRLVTSSTAGRAKSNGPAGDGFAISGTAYAGGGAGSVEAVLVRIGSGTRVKSITSSATPTLNTDVHNVLSITALAVAITSMTTNLSGTPADEQKLIVKIKDNGTGRAITWGASFEAKGADLPTTTTASKLLRVGLIYDATAAKWGCVAVAEEA